MSEIEFSNKIETFFNEISKINDQNKIVPPALKSLLTLIDEAEAMEASNTATFLELCHYLLQYDSENINQQIVDEIFSKIEENLEMWKKPAFKLPEVLNWVGTRLLAVTNNAEDIDFVKKVFKKAIDLAKATNNVPTVAISSLNLAHAYEKSGEALKAARLFEIAASIDQTDENVAYCLRHAAILYYKSGNLEKSLNLVKIAVKYRKKLFQPLGQLLLFQTDLSREYALKFFTDENKAGQALNYLNEAIQVLEELGNVTELAEVYLEAATIHQKLSNSDEAIENLHLSRKLSVSCNHVNVFIKSTFKLVLLYMELENYEKALEITQETKSGVVLQEEDLKNLNSLGSKINDWLTKTKSVPSERGEIEPLKSTEIVHEPMLSTSNNSTDGEEQPIDKLSTSEDMSREIANDNDVQFTGTLADLMKPSEEEFEDVFAEETAEQEDIQLLDDQEMVEQPIEAQSTLDLSPTRSNNQTIASSEQQLDEQDTGESTVAIDESREIPSEQTTSEVEGVEEAIIETPSARRTYLRSKKKITAFFKRCGYQVSHDSVPFGSTSSVDTIAQKGTVRKHKIFLQLAQNPADATISTYILQGITERGVKLIFLLTGDEKDVYVPRGINITSKIFQLKRFVK
ncbi:MAG: tetratricopeptide repeat protein [Candidatus Hodarchaeales archaeon]|jgi:tetratricopeptide (TPR) repeat protein